MNKIKSFALLLILGIALTGAWYGNSVLKEFQLGRDGTELSNLKSVRVSYAIGSTTSETFPVLGVTSDDIAVPIYCFSSTTETSATAAIKGTKCTLNNIQVFWTADPSATTALPIEFLIYRKR